MPQNIVSSRLHKDEQWSGTKGKVVRGAGTALLALTLLTILVLPVQAEEPIVRAVFFASPTCPFCLQAKTQVITPLSEKYGRALQIASVDVTQPEGQSLYLAAIEAFNIPEDRRGVPTLIIGDTVLVGSGEVARQFPGLVERGLAGGGVAWPAIPGLTEALEEIAPTPAALPKAATAQRASGRVESYFAMVTLVGMAVSFCWVIGQGILTIWRGRRRPARKPRAWQAPVVPVLCILGLAVAGYLAYADLTEVEAFCGPIGDCNALQESDYASLFGRLPVSILGVIGYLLILASWAIGRYGHGSPVRVARVAQLGLTLLGTVFSIYLMIVGSFVVGAICLWCLLSALAMTLLMWLSARPGWQALLG